MEEKINIQQINPITFEYQEYSNEDLSLISSTNVDVIFDPLTDYIEYFVYSLNGDLIINLSQGYRNYTLIDNLVSIDPASDLINVGLTNGTYNSVYNFLSNKLGSSQFNTFYIQDISQDRTELRLNSINILDAELSILTPEFISELTATGDYIDFALNFGSNQLVIANNLLLDSSNPDDLSILIKLYEPLPSDFSVKSECWVVKEVAESIAYNISIEQIFSNIDEKIQLKGPNVNLSIKDQINNSTVSSNYSNLISTSTPQGSGSFHYQINSLLAEKGIEINVDYSNYSNFINFSSAQTRVENFYYKLSLIEEYNYSASLSSGTTTNYYVSSSNNIWQDKINEIITGFDGYEYYLYYDSGSTCWPKSNTEPPYTNVETTSIIGQNWLISQSAVALSFDKENNNALINSIPEYLRDDPSNSQYELFIEMIGQHFDNIFIYLQDVTEKYNADNRLNYGVSKNLVADILRDMGIKIYQNNFSSDDLYSALLGFTPSGSLYNLPYTTGSLPTPEGWEYIDTYITASATGSLYPTDDINASIYKRIYHNLPYLLKKKGTIEGLRTLITIYGIPDTILRVNEFGGKDKNNQNDWDLWYNQFDYKYNTLDSGYVVTDWVIPSWSGEDSVPQTIEFRFKTPGLDSALTYPSQSLWQLDSDIEIYLEYTGSGYTSGSYSGSIPNPENEYANLVFNASGTTGSISLPFFNGGWWSVAVTRTGDNFELFAGNNIYTGEEGSSIGFTGSDSLTSSAGGGEWGNGTISTFASASLYSKFSGSLQEIRYYDQPLSQSVFNDYVMNHNSIEGNGINSSANHLAFRASLGGELYTGSTSIHPKVTGSYITESFSGGSTFTITNGEFNSNEEYVYFDQFPAGIKNRISDKIKQVNTILPYSGSDTNIPNNNSLSPFISVQQTSYVSESYTRDLDYVEVAFSPQNEINDDIIDSLGYFNIGEYIGDPRQVSSSSEYYPDLDALRNLYFDKYKSNYNWWDYIRLIKYLDNSLFKMIKDWVPARTSLASGIVIKQHLLERNKYPVPQLNTYTTTSFEYLNNPFVFQNLEITGSSIQMYTVTGSNGGTMPNLNGEISGSGPGFNIVPITQSWSGSTPSLLGPVPFTHTSQTEFFDGELSGSNLIVTTQSLNPNNPFLQIDTTILNYTASITSSENTPINNWLGAPVTLGKIYLYFDSSSLA